MDNKKFIWIGIISLILVILIVFLYLNFFVGKQKRSESFKVDSVFLKISMEQNKVMTNSLEVTNLKDSKEHFDAEISGLSNFVIIKEKEFDIEAGKTKNLELIFKTNDSAAGIYLGQFRIISNGEVKNISVILEVQSEDVLFDSNIDLFPQGDFVLGQKLTANIKIFDLSKIGRSKIDITYAVSDFEGNTIVSQSEDLVIDGKIDYSKSVNIPAIIKTGDYIFYVVVRYKNSIGTSSVLLSVNDEKTNGWGNNSLISWAVVIFVFFFFMFLLLFIYSILDRDKLLNELKEGYKREIKKQNELMKLREKSAFKELKKLAERRLYKREVERVKKRRISALKKIHKKRLAEYEKTKKKGKSDELRRQVEKWKKQGYDTILLDDKYKMPDVSEIKRKVSIWKKQGYDTSVLEKS